MPFISGHGSVLAVHFQTISMHKAFFNCNELKSGVCLSKSFLSLYVLADGCQGKPFSQNLRTQSNYFFFNKIVLDLNNELI